MQMRSVYFIFILSVLMTATPGFAASKSLGAETASAIMAASVMESP